MDMMDQLGELAFASRLKRLSERLMRDGSMIYGDESVDFEAKWFPLLYLLGCEAPLPVTGIARSLRLTHPAVNQMAGEMTARGLIQSEKDPGDERKRLLSLTRKGMELRAKLEPLWGHIAEATRELIAETGFDLLGAIETIELSLDRTNLRDRVNLLNRRRQLQEVEILEYSPDLAGDFRELNLQWLQKDFQVEPEDEKILGNPEGEVLDRGGFILFARHGERIIGTCAIIRRNVDEFELCKLAVHQDSRGIQAGRRLLLAAINRARYGGARRLYLHTCDKLTAANSLYKKTGFVRASRDDEVPHSYSRPSYTMILDLEKQLPLDTERTK